MKRLLILLLFFFSTLHAADEKKEEAPPPTTETEEPAEEPEEKEQHFEPFVFLKKIEHKGVQYIQLTDGSYWEIPRARRLATSWVRGDKIQIKKSSRIYYPFILFNMNRDEEIQARESNVGSEIKFDNGAIDASSDDSTKELLVKILERLERIDRRVGETLEQIERNTRNR